MSESESASDHSPSFPRQEQPFNCWPRAVFFAVVSVAFCLWALMTPAVFEWIEGEFTLGFMLGGIAGSVGLLGIWAVLGSQRTAIRWPLTMLVTVALPAFSILGIYFWTNTSINDVWEMSLALLIIPTLFVCVQLPLWPLWWFGWRIFEPGDPLTAEKRAGIASMLFATAAIAATLGLSRLGIAIANVPAPADLWTALAVSCLTSFVLSLVSTLPVLFLAMRWLNPLMAAFATAVYTSGVVLVSLAIFAAALRPDPEFVVMLTIFAGMIATVLLVGLLLLRNFGYQLKRSGARHTATATPPANP